MAIVSKRSAVITDKEGKDAYKLELELTGPDEGTLSVQQMVFSLNSPKINPEEMVSAIQQLIDDRGRG